MNYQAFKKIKAIENGYKRLLKETYPRLTEDSGIYSFTRVDNDTGIKYAYVGQAKHLCRGLRNTLRGDSRISIGRYILAVGDCQANGNSRGVILTKARSMRKSERR